MSHPTPIVRVRTDTQAAILEDPDRPSLKRIAWAYGCSKKDSDEEAALYRVLIYRANKERPAP